MRTFAFYIEDKRYSTPTLRFVNLRDEAGARELAAHELVASSDHLSVEVLEDGRVVFRQERG